ncbi:MAG: hypothetical protein RIQ38_2605 [Pseudomonadota bacterium]|jgi:hypothetical protein
MNQQVQISVLIALCLLAANWPFFSQRLVLVGPRRADKSLAWRLLELLLLYLLVGGIGLAMENALGQIAPQGWEFYAVSGAMFLTLAFPGFVWRYLWRRRGA